MIDIDFISEAYEASPNNATGKLLNELMTAYPEMTKPSNAMEVEFQNCKYSVSISSGNVLEARQFRSTNDGLISFSTLRNEVLFISRNELTLSNSPTRIGSDGSKFFNAKGSLGASGNHNLILSKIGTPEKKKDKIFLEKTIFITEDYSKFKAISGQPKERAKKNSIKLSKEIKSTGGNYIPIIVNETFQVIDGNTRLEACKSLDLPVKYEIISSDDVNSLELMRYMNAANKPWNPYNFIEFYALGWKISEFIDLKEFIDERSFGLGIYTSFDSKITQESIREGSLPIIDYAKLEDKLSYLSTIKELVGDSIPSLQGLARAIERFYNYGAFDKSRLISSLSTNWFQVLKTDKMNKVAGEYLIASMLQKCYNYKLSKVNKVRIFKEEL